VVPLMLAIDENCDEVPARVLTLASSPIFLATYITSSKVIYAVKKAERKRVWERLCLHKGNLKNMYQL